MEEKVGRSLSFSVAGGFVTQTAREWFWLEHKPWPVVEEFLLSCMAGTEQTENELKALARDVVFGRAKFIGNTGDGSYALTEDSQDLVVLNVERMSLRMKAVERDLKELQEKYLSLVDRIEDEGYEWLLGPQSGPSRCPALTSPLLDSYLQQAKIEQEFDDNYGWLAPDGTFHPVEFAEHQGWAFDQIESTAGWYDEYRKWSGKLQCERAGDFLVEAKGWVLLHNPSRGIAFVTGSDTRPMTNAQKEFLFDYYTARSNDDLAKKYLEE